MLWTRSLNKEGERTKERSYKSKSKKKKTNEEETRASKLVWNNHAGPDRKSEEKRNQKEATETEAEDAG